VAKLSIMSYRITFRNNDRPKTQQLCALCEKLSELCG